MTWKTDLTDKLLLWKLYWNRANSHLSLPLSILEKIGLLIVVLKVFNVTNWYIVGAVFVVLIVLFFYIGFLDVKYKIIDRETSLSNSFNPEMQILLRKK